MRIAMIILFFAAAVALWWWLRKRSYELDLTLSKPDWVLIAVPLIVAVALTGFEARWLWRQHEATMMVRQVSGVPTADVSCQRWSDAWREVRTYKGWVYQGDDTAHLLHSTCQELFSWLDGDGQNPTVDQLVAVEIVAHEAVHVGGEFNEAVTECVAMKKLPALLMSTRDLSEEQAVRLANAYREHVHPRLPTFYQGVNSC